ncbi:hypothetical protein ACPPVQ_16000 [Diaminobutyricibacter sp. McL0618]|uniref:hypothetical protein n=1 Tax=Leifsonia sp. McL0618 TaxID=3415677 RepID=UPI003CF43170
MSTSLIPRWAGIGLLVYAVGTLAAAMFTGSPGGEYSAADVAAYTAPGHAPTALVLWYIAALSALALVVFGAGIRRLPAMGRPLSALASIGAAVSITGTWLAGGIAVGMLEGGSAVRSGVAAPVVYLFTEIGHAMSMCGPAMCVGVIGIVLAVRGALPVWLRVVSVIGGVCGILAPFFFTFFLYVLWVVVLGVVILATRRVPAVPRVESAASIV